MVNICKQCKKETSNKLFCNRICFGNFNKGKPKSLSFRKKLSSIKKRMAKNGELKGLFKQKGVNLAQDKIRSNTQYKKGCKRPEMEGDNSPMRRPEVLKKNLRRRNMSSMEKDFQNVCTKYHLPFKFVGNGKFFIERYNPDFINTNGEKIAVEVYYKYFKEIDGRTIESYKRARNKVFAKYGWKIVYFDETEMDEDFILARLRGLNEI